MSVCEKSDGYDIFFLRAVRGFSQYGEHSTHRCVMPHNLTCVAAQELTKANVTISMDIDSQSTALCTTDKARPFAA